MASLWLDITNTVDEFPTTFADRLHELTANLGLTFDVARIEVNHDGPIIEFTGRPDALAILIRRYEDDPGLRAELRDRIHYVPPMAGSCES